MFVKQIQNGLDLTDEAKNITAIYDTSLEPGQGIPLHFHPDHEEIYYILSTSVCYIIRKSERGQR
jgi:quercetin dioxygenase-like cupin family protein